MRQSYELHRDSGINPGHIGPGSLYGDTPQDSED